MVSQRCTVMIDPGHSGPDEGRRDLTVELSDTSTKRIAALKSILVELGLPFLF